MGPGLRDLHRTHLIDLSLPISSSTAEPDPPKIEYVDHGHAATALAAMATQLLQQAFPHATGSPVITEAAFDDHLGLANANLQFDSHAGTHMDAPWHFGPLCGNYPSKTI